MITFHGNYNAWKSKQCASTESSTYLSRLVSKSDHLPRLSTRYPISSNIVNQKANHYKLLWFFVYFLYFFFSQIHMITIIYETKYQSTDNATQQCGVILSRMVKHGNAVGGWGRWARCYYSNGFSKHPVNRRLPSTLAKDKKGPTWSRVFAYLVFYLARNMQRLFAYMQSVKSRKTTFPGICGTSCSIIRYQNCRTLIIRISCSADINARKKHLLMAVQNDDLKEIVRDFLTFEISVADGILRPNMPD